MWSSSDSDPDLTTTTASSSSSPSSSPPPPRRRLRRQRRTTTRKPTITSAAVAAGAENSDAEADADDVWRGAQWEAAWSRRTKPVVVVAAEDPPTVISGGGATTPGGGDDGGGVGRARSLTDDDLEELKGCVDLGFGFSYDEIPELCGTLPALELCYSMSQRFLDDHHHNHSLPSPPESAAATPLPALSPSPSIPNWKISSPGDSPDEVKARLKYWAQAVACTVRLCS